MDGLLTTDERTNTVIVRDLKENVDEIARTIEALDAPTPAVVVEARIVEVTNTAAEQLGVQWGLNFSADQAHGNALPFEFPNSVGVTGGVGGEDGNFMVNLPAASPAGGIGLSFGHIANTLSLDLRLQALEQMNEVKILSNPRVLVVQNQEATINLGQQLPIPSTDAEGNRTVNFQDVGIKLVVTPQVTNDERVFMDIEVEKSSRGENVPTTEGTMFSINSRRAQTQVLIQNGETAVIGGLTVEEHSDIDTAVPGFSKIPGLGWLFKSKDKQTRRDEMMIFLTPRIVDVI
jgi:type IV pilus assembly protein PilQ